MRIQRFGIAVLLATALAIPATPLFAQGRGRGDQERYQGQDKDHADHGRGHHKGHRDDRDHRYFRDRDHDEIAAYYRDRRLPPGLAKRDELPPGIERQLSRGKKLPPGLRGRIVWFPPDLDRRLGPLPDGYRRCWIGNNVVIVNPRNYAIVDVMFNFQFDLH